MIYLGRYATSLDVATLLGSPPLLAPHHLAVCSLLAFVQREDTTARRRLISDGVYNLMEYLHVRGTFMYGVYRLMEYVRRRGLQYNGVPPRTGSVGERSTSPDGSCSTSGCLHGRGLQTDGVKEGIHGRGYVTRWGIFTVMEYLH